MKHLSLCLLFVLINTSWAQDCKNVEPWDKHWEACLKKEIASDDDEDDDGSASFVEAEKAMDMVEDSTERAMKIGKRARSLGSKIYKKVMKINKKTTDDLGE